MYTTVLASQFSSLSANITIYNQFFVVRLYIYIYIFFPLGDWDVCKESSKERVLKWRKVGPRVVQMGILW